MAASYYAQKQLDWAATVVPELPNKMVILASEPSVIVSRDGKVLESISTEFRRPVKLKDVPELVKQATLAAEDKRFYAHQGVDFWAMGRAAVSTFTGKRTEGASTITMQIAKRVFTSTAKTMDRKVKDMALAIMIERELSKDQILELYLNQIYYGSGAYGISAAAEVYFGKKLDDLTYAEAALLARCVRRPSDENPYVDEKMAMRNRGFVLAIMHDEGWLTDAQYAKAKAEPLALRRVDKEDKADRLAPYFCDYVKSWLKDNMPEIDLRKGGYRIETTLDMGMQKYTEGKVRDMVAKNRRLKISTSAFILLDNEGQIISMVGGPDYDKNQFNVITQGRRQPGSSFKPLVYATAFELGALNPGGSVSNEPFYQGYGAARRKTRGGGRGGSVSIRSAIASSINTPAMWAAQEAGVENVIQMSHQAFGIKTELAPVQTIALGADEVTPMEMAVAYSVFQSGGDRFEPYGVTKVIGSDGIPIRSNAPVWQRRQLSSSSAEGIDTCLRAVVTSGTGRSAGWVTNARGKTGTTSANKDAWFCGYTDKFIGVGWVANETKDKSGRVRYLPMNDYVMGGHMVAPMWASIVGHAQKLFGEESRRMRGGRDTVVRDEDPTPVEENTDVDTTPDFKVEEPSEAAPDPDATEDPASNPTGDGGEMVRDRPLESVKETPPDEGTRVTFVEICADTGMRASIYCPERQRKAFRTGSEPRKRCTTHRPSGG